MEPGQVVKILSVNRREGEEKEDQDRNDWKMLIRVFRRWRWKDDKSSRCGEVTVCD
jgi:hypothetical protein